MECYKCGKSGEEVRLLDGISNEEIVKICESCSSSENLPIIKRPSTLQLKESERPYNVVERLRRMAGLVPEAKQEAVKIAKKITNITLDDLRKKKNREEELKEKYEIAKKGKKPLNLVDNFHWHVFMARRKRKLTRGELAKELGESETVIKMIEHKEFPDDYERLIRKLEQFLDIKLRKAEEIKEEERVEEAVKDRLEGEFLQKSSKESEQKSTVEKDEKEKEEKEPVRILKVDKKSVGELTISDLQEMKEKKEGLEILKKQSKMEADELMSEIEKEEKDEWKEEADKNLTGDEVEFD